MYGQFWFTTVFNLSASGVCVKRHYETLQKNKYDKYTGEARTAVCNDLKAKLQKQKQTLFRPTTVQTSSLVASYSVSFELAKSKKPSSDGEIIKRCAIQMALAFVKTKLRKVLKLFPYHTKQLQGELLT